MWTLGNQLELLAPKEGGQPTAASAFAMLPSLVLGAQLLLEAEIAAGWPLQSLPAIAVPVSLSESLSSLCPTLPGGFLCEAYSALWKVESMRHRMVLSVQAYGTTSNGTFLKQVHLVAVPSLLVPAQPAPPPPHSPKPQSPPTPR